MEKKKVRKRSFPLPLAYKVWLLSAADVLTLTWSWCPSWWHCRQSLQANRIQSVWTCSSQTRRWKQENFFKSKSIGFCCSSLSPFLQYFFHYLSARHFLPFMLFFVQQRQTIKEVYQHNLVCSSISFVLN